MAQVQDGFTKIACSYCGQYLHKTETIAWRGNFPYHPHHAKFHHPIKTERVVPRFNILTRGVDPRRVN